MLAFKEVQSSFKKLNMYFRSCRCPQLCQVQVDKQEKPWPMMIDPIVQLAPNGG